MKNKSVTMDGGYLYKVSLYKCTQTAATSAARINNTTVTGLNDEGESWWESWE